MNFKLSKILFLFVVLTLQSLKAEEQATILSTSNNESVQPAATNNVEKVDIQKINVDGEIKSSSAIHGVTTDLIEKQDKVFSVSMYTLGGYDVDQLKASNPSYTIYDSYVAFSFKIHRDWRILALPAFGYTTAGQDNQGNTVTDKAINRDLSIAVMKYNLFNDLDLDDFDLKNRTRLYLPTSDQSKDEGMIARLRFESEGKYYLTRFSYIRGWIKPGYYFQRNTSFLDNTGKIKTSRQWDSQHGAEVSFGINKYFSFAPGFELEDKYSFSSDANNRDQRHDNTISYRLGLEVRPLKVFSFIIGYQDKRDLIQTNRDAELSYSLLTNFLIY